MITTLGILFFLNSTIAPVPDWLWVLWSLNVALKLLLTSNR
jgi:hypothetical protein